VDRGDLLGNAILSEDCRWKLLLSRFSKPVDRSLWGMLPADQHAYYDPTRISHFPGLDPAAALFRSNADPASNYGRSARRSGMRSGTGFDDQGPQVRCARQAHRLVSAATAKLYTAHADVLVAQYKGYDRSPACTSRAVDARRKPRRSRRLEVAYAAYRKYVSDHGERW